MQGDKCAKERNLDKPVVEMSAESHTPAIKQGFSVILWLSASPPFFSTSYTGKQVQRSLSVRACVAIHAVVCWFGTLLCQNIAAIHNFSAQNCATHVMFCTSNALLCPKIAATRTFCAHQCTADEKCAREVHCMCAPSEPAAQIAVGGV